MDLKRRLGIRIRTLRAQKRLSQEEIAALIDRSVDAVSKIERGVSLPGLDTLIRLAEPLGVTVPELLEPLWRPGTGDPARAELEAALIQLARSLDDRSLRIAIAQIRVLAEAGSDSCIPK
jgi:transcriptional regulator with XRE-family HTH domain